jgi:DNA-directed RNA polymerase specialized sigma24 family protein
MLVQQGAGGAYAADKAAELAQQACVLIFRALYPCDVAFDAWSHTVLRNVVRAARSRSRDVLDRGPFVRSLDEWQECADGDEVGVAGMIAAAGEAGLHGATPLDDGPGVGPDMPALIDAIRQMRSANRRAVLVYTYFLDLDDGEIAEKLGRNRDDVQVLRHRALRQLRSIVEQEDC